MTKRPVKPTEAKVRIAAYIRVATQQQLAAAPSIEFQKNAITRYIEDRKQIDDWKVESIEFYSDIGASGLDRTRPELQRLLRDVTEGRLHTVVCACLSRLSRKTRDLADLWNHLAGKGVGLIGLKEKLDTSTPLGEAMMTMLTRVFAEMEGDVSQERTSEE